ncbi:HAD family hydrolase [Streptomyces sp. NPDC020898]|uniref:HAD family hydrolase n=1 Tax=Streptomyces sp. NPDC020898 TaxID=3365101 RepID=UPI0037BAFD7C
MSGRRPMVVATDLDGTLLRGDLTVSSYTRAMLRRLDETGIRHIIVTGRPASGCGALFRSLGYRGLAVCGQGAQIYDVDSDVLLSHAELDRGAAQAFVARLTSRIGPVHLAVVTSGPRGEFLTTSAFSRGDERELSPLPPVHSGDLWSRPIDKVLLRHDTLSDTELVAEADVCCAPGLRVTHAGPRIVELLPTGFDKATGLSRVCAVIGAAPRDVVAFGDMPNDIPMLTWAGHAFAMANGHPRLKAVADEIAPHHDEDGVAVVLDRLLRETVPEPGGNRRRLSPR